MISAGGGRSILFEISLVLCRLVGCNFKAHYFVWVAVTEGMFAEESDSVVREVLFLNLIFLH